MIGNIFSVLNVARHAVAITLVTGAAGAMVAGASDVATHETQATQVASVASTQTVANKTTSELAELVKACLATKDPQSGECAKAIEMSGLSVEEFWPKVAMSLAGSDRNEHRAENAKPHAEQLLQFVTACVASHDRSSKYCEKALEVSGLSADSFWAKVGPLFAKTEPKTTEPTTKPEQPKKTSEELYGLLKDCLSKYEHAKDSNDGPSLASEACRKAIEASGLTTDEFWKRFAPKHEAKPEATRKPEETRKPQTAPTVTSPQLEALVKDCFAKYTAARNAGWSTETQNASLEACHKAIAASGLSPEAFFRKFGSPTGN